MEPQIVVLDFGSQFSHLIARRIRELEVYAEVLPNDTTAEQLRSMRDAKNLKGIILSGGPASIYEQGAPKMDAGILGLGIPLLGLCYGHQLLAGMTGGKVVSGEKKEYGIATLQKAILQKQKDKDYDSILLKGLDSTEKVWMNHGDSVIALGRDFIGTASTENCKYAAYENHQAKIYGLQFHPEVHHTPCGRQLLGNFALEICGAEKDFGISDFIEQAVKDIRQKASNIQKTNSGQETNNGQKTNNRQITNSGQETNNGQKTNNRQITDNGQETGNREKTNNRQITDNGQETGNREKTDNGQITHDEQKTVNKTVNRKAIIGLSGGIDSVAAGVLAGKALGQQLQAILVDTGYMRLNEPEQVKQAMMKLGINLIVVDARQKFYDALRGVEEPEQKRKIIGKLFIDVFTEEAKKTGAEILIQGTIYPDRIESGISKHSSVIKTHHNVGGLPKDMKLEVVEPLRDLYKDEVRALALKLGVSQELVQRHPFPGPGLAVRIIGEASEERTKIVAKANAIVEEELKKSGLYAKVWQAFAVLLPVRSVGVQGDARSYKNVIAIRIVNSVDAMTAEFANIPYELLERMSSRITNEITEINRVVYDVTHKPPATIEWE